MGAVTAAHVRLVHLFLPLAFALAALIYVWS